MRFTFDPFPLLINLTKHIMNIQKAVRQIILAKYEALEHLLGEDLR